MTLPFQKPNDAERQYTCFVCGRAYKDFEEFKAHIIEKHQEGREYVLCPLARCGAPVRDVRAHFKVKHPKEPPPKGCQMKAIVWKDQRDPKTGRKKRGMHFNEGDFESAKCGKKLHYRSGYELEVYKCLEQMPNVKRYDAEPFGIPYWFKGEQHTYFPDLSVQFADGRVEVWEIKPSSQTSYEVNDAKWTAADKWCEARGYHFEVKTEQGIRLLRETL
jgi:hypothetical protein